MHVAVPVDPKDANNKKKFMMECVHGTVTNLCDFRIQSAEWHERIVYADTVLCKVCRSRANRPAG